MTTNETTTPPSNPFVFGLPKQPECVDSTGFIKRGKKLLMKILYPFASALRLRLMPMF